ncbi:Transcriptinal regulator, LysR family [Azotobacter vinelandii CA]|uniref:Transcriptinal regulator, LysR family n=2 Tax=Azotobacter vinelandii TaxID=354 RepID=C1DGS2_AZOVD|nr:LysR family transcriptional regulator [Azotobacter vinelandii]ACO80568.1 Transcriptinal regulator, LysR family [Azotobacter vinelandii DJ]AGK14347.1 Transcriptinal regulator, LysR family [Azotobacter vinelandii CA]AGK22018.1 Transcriptinal regulator, LysR family [Azotobacter vinelandii CA6]SFX37324.1 DNA-binding transcriptional regulator, LysR family [Azotobacter vinelandii]
MIELRQLRYFMALAEHLHFGKAAESLHITQPPLSRQISALEADLGVVLFSRHSRSVELTAAGRDFQQHAKTALAELDLAIRSTRASARGERGELRVSFTMVAAWILLPELLKAYSDAYPDVSLALNEVLPRDLGPALERGEADIALTFPSSGSKSLCYRALRREPLCAVLPASHPLAAATEFSIAALADEPFITFPRQTAPALHEAVMSCCRRAGFEPKIRLETHLQQTIVNLVAEGLGVSVVPGSMRKMRMPGVAFKAIDRSPPVEYGVIWNPRNENPCLNTFLRCVGVEETGDRGPAQV